MAHRASKRPHVSVIMAVHDAEAHLMRAVESVLTPDVTDVQVVIVDCASSDSTAAIAARMAERDIRVDARTAEHVDPAGALDAGLACARGTYVLFMGQDDWFAPHGLARLLDAAETGRLDLVVPRISLDTYRGRGECTRIVVVPEMSVSRSAAEFRRSVPALLDAGLLDTVRGKLLRLDAVREAGLGFHLAVSDLAFLIGYLDGVERAGAVVEASYHLTVQVTAHAGFEAARHSCCERDHELLLDLADRWGMREVASFMIAVHRHHLSCLVSCIENVCVGGRLLSTIERNARVRAMLEKRSTCESVRVLHERYRELGFMYGPIAKRNVAACCMGVRLVGFMRASRLPLAPLLRDANDCWESLSCVVGRGISDGRQGHLEGDRA